MNITVIDDDQNAANFLVDMLRMLGHTAIATYAPGDAIQHFNRLIPDVIFLDMNMPGVNGLDVCRYLRRDPRTAKIVIIVISAHDERIQIEAARSAGANYYIIKPAMLEDLEKALEIVKPLVSSH